MLSLMKNSAFLKRRFFLNFLLTLFFLGNCYAALKSEPQTWFTLKITVEPSNDNRQFRYAIKMPFNTYFSYYLGSDLPRWKYRKSCTMSGIIHPVELINVRIHPHSDNVHSGVVYLSVLDLTKKKTVWQGRLIYSGDQRPVQIFADADNQQSYTTKVYFQQDLPTVWFETETKP